MGLHFSSPRKLLQKGADLLASCQKLIWLVDRLEFGWAIVSEYEANVLTYGSNDEKRIDKVEKAMERKSLKRKRP